MSRHPLSVITHPACLEHRCGDSHPERPERLQAVLEALDSPPFDTLPRLEAARADSSQLKLAHEPVYVQRIFDLSPANGLIALDPDTYMGPASLEAALRAAGALCQAVDEIVAGRSRRVFCAVRPPGHHAEPDRAMGFCFFNNVAVGALHALENQDFSRVAVVDFDVHHGNGSQAILADEPRCLYLSSHQSPLYPGTGERTSSNEHVINAPLPPNADPEAFRAVWREELLPALDSFQPQLLFISAGFDGHRLDPLAQMRLETDDFGWLTGKLVRVAEQHAQGRVVSALEGGYHLEALKDSVRAHLQALGAD